MSLNQDFEFRKICRLCMSNDTRLISIFTSQHNSNLLFSDMIMSMSTVKITTDDLLPSCICLKCIDKILKAYSFKIECEKSEKILQDCLEKKIQYENNQKTNNKPEKISQISMKGKYAPHLLSQYINQVASEKTIEEATSQISSTNIFKCSYCDHAVLTEETLKRHVASKHNRGKEEQSNNNTQPILNQCCFCYYVFENKHNLKMHLVAKHLNTNHGKQTSGTCYLCGLESIDINYHLNEHYKHLYCNKCKMKFDDRKTFEAHMKEEMSTSTSRNFTCNEADRKSIKKLDNNTLTQNKKKCKPTTDIYKCTQCRKCCFSQAGLKSHLRVHLRCIECGKSFNTHSSLEAHLHSHTEDVFKCKECNESFNKSHQLEHHYYLMHAKKIIKRHLCDTCGKSFARFETLKSHLGICG